MKTRIASLLSLGGVLIAGSAAAIVNTQILADSGSGGSASSAAAISVQATGTGEPTDTPVVTSTTAVGTVTSVASAPPDLGSAAPPDLGPSAPPSAVTQASYQVGDAGTVTLDTAGDRLTILSATPNPGWTVTNAESSGPLAVEVAFRAGTTVVEFKASLLFGIVSTSVEAVDQGVNGSASSTPNTFDDHGGDDEDNSGHGSSGSGGGGDSSGSGSGGGDHDDDD